MKKNPRTMTVATFIISADEPKLGANGSVTKEGTKKTGNHLAKTAAPGLKRLHSPSPHSALTAFSASNVAKSDPQAERDEGKVMDSSLNVFRKAMSIAMNDIVDAMDVIMDGALFSEEEAEAPADIFIDD